MGRELRRVPANWNHPIVMRTYGARQEEGYQPMYDEEYALKLGQWLDEKFLWAAGKHPKQEDYSYEEYAGDEPDPAYYRPWKEEEATWYQLWETVSEGTPVTPPFETPEELIDYLATKGDFWKQHYNEPPYSRTGAERVVKGGYAPSFIVHNGIVSNGVDGLK